MPTVSGVSSPAVSTSSSSGANPTLRKGSKGAAVKEMQQLLKNAGFDPGGIDGSFGPATQRALKSFQSAKGLEADGICGPKTWNALKSTGATTTTPTQTQTQPTTSSFDTPAVTTTGTTKTLKQGAKGPEVTELQVLLKNAGFDPGPIDGDFGARTTSAVMLYQMSRGLDCDGVCGPATWRALRTNAPVTDSFTNVETKVVTGYVKGVAQQITLAKVTNGKWMRVDAAAKFNSMAAAAAADGITLKVNSGFRTMEQQQAAYADYLNGGNLAAKPGYSNHQGGLSAAIAMSGYSSATYRWLEDHAAAYGFKNDVRGEYWHWTYKP